MNVKNIAVNNYKRFCGLEGNDFIASEFALETILNLIEKFQITSILELGLGIGSISDTVFKYAKEKNISVKYVGTENNEFCLNALKSNVEGFEKIELFSELNSIEKQKFEFIIIDGYDQTLIDIAQYCDEKTIIFIEGDRSEQTDTILDIFPKSLYVNVVTLNKNKIYAAGACEPTHYVGGGKLIFVHPNLKMKLFWFKEKVKTAIIRKIRLVNE